MTKDNAYQPALSCHKAVSAVDGGAGGSEWRGVGASGGARGVVARGGEL